MAQVFGHLAGEVGQCVRAMDQRLQISVATGTVDVDHGVYRLGVEFAGQRLAPEEAEFLGPDGRDPHSPGQVHRRQDPGHPREDRDATPVVEGALTHVVCVEVCEHDHLGVCCPGPGPATVVFA